MEQAEFRRGGFRLVHALPGWSRSRAAEISGHKKTVRDRTAIGGAGDAFGTRTLNIQARWRRAEKAGLK